MREKDEARFWAKVALPNGEGCMLWMGRLNRKGYAQFDLGRGSKLAHRVAYFLAYGPIPNGMEIDHVKARGCRHRHCVAPDHLEAVTHAENMRRSGVAKYWRHNANARKTHCAKDHPYDEESTYHPPRGGRICRKCRDASLARLAAKRRKVA